MQYRLKARIHPDPGLDNADRFQHRLRFGREKTFLTGHGLSQEFYLGPVFRLEFRNQVDRDDGTDREFRGVGISDRYSFVSDGFEARYRIEFKRLSLRARAEIERRNYNSAGESVEYDHVKYAGGVVLDFRLSKLDSFRLVYNFAKRDYRERPARGLTGDLDSANPSREYHDNRIELSLRRRFSKHCRAKAGYRLSHRDDQYVGYDDYLQYRIGLSIHAKLASRARAVFDTKYSHKNYPRAFAFNNPLQKAKAKDILSISGETEIDLGHRLTLVGSLSYRDEKTSDARYRYARVIGSLGLRIDF